jgi:hypothetical protein
LRSCSRMLCEHLDHLLSSTHLSCCLKECSACMSRTWLRVPHLWFDCYLGEVTEVTVNTATVAVSIGSMLSVSQSISWYGCSILLQQLISHEEYMSHEPFLHEIQCSPVQWAHCHSLM